MQDVRDKITGLIRRSIEDTAGLEMVTSAGKPTPRGGHDTTLIYAQRGTATRLTIAAAWYPGSAAFDLTGPAIRPVPPGERKAGDGYREDARGKPGYHVFLGYSEGPAIDALLRLLDALLGQPEARS